MKKVLVIVILTTFSITSYLNGATIWSENFDDLSNGTTITNSNTDWENVRTGTGGGPIEAKKPSSFDATTSMILGASSGGSITVVSAYDLDMDPDTYGDQLGTKFTVSFDVKFTGDTGDFYLFVGDGDVYSGNSGFSYATTLIGIKWDLPTSPGTTITLQNCNAVWGTLDPIGNFDFEIGSTYRVAIVGNMSGSSYNYTAGTVGNDKYDLWVDSGSGWVLRLDDVVLNSDQTLSGMDSFRFFGVDGANGNIELDDIELLNEGDSTLPIILSTFTAQYLNSKPTLYWQTQSETDNMGWFIYRNTIEYFTSSEKISGMIPGQGTTTEPQSYIYEDAEELQIEQTYYYWLESVDYSGTIHHYDRVAQVTIPHPNEPGQNVIPPIAYEISADPNPFSYTTNISFVMDQPSLVDVAIYNVKGQLVKSFNSVMTSQENETVAFSWNGKNDAGKSLSNGVYLYLVKVNGKDYATKQLILMK